MIVEYLLKQRNTKDFDVIQDKSCPVAKRVICEDGFSMSVQASWGAYCSPRTNIAVWDTVEVGYPSAYEANIIEYAEEEDSPLTTIYGYVPVEIVDQIIAKHGGFAKKKDPFMFDVFPH